MNRKEAEELARDQPVGTLLVFSNVPPWIKESPNSWRHHTPGGTYTADDSSMGNSIHSRSTKASYEYTWCFL